MNKKKQLFKFCPICRYYLKWSLVEGKKRLVCKKCGWINYNNPLPVAVCAAKDNKDRMLIVKRNEEPGANRWSLPGGFIESGEDPQAACLRELKEETGLEGEITRLIGIYLRKCKVYGSLLVIGYEVKLKKIKVSINNEIKEARFASRQDLPYVPFSTHRKMIEETYQNKK